jgi:hypothetical protein
MSEIWSPILVGLALIILLYLRAYDLVSFLLAAVAGTWHIYLKQSSKLMETPIAVAPSPELRSEDFQKSIIVMNMGSWAATILILILVFLARVRRYQFPVYFPYLLAPLLLFLAKTMVYQVEVTGNQHVGSGWNVFESSSVPIATVLFNLLSVWRC